VLEIRAYPSSPIACKPPHVTQAVEIVQGIFREILSRQTGMKTEDVERIEQEVVEAFKGNKVGL
jgi:CRISPR/Cas system type I-B associated protein Csh2 (Cas7 group RAMP superfamily)